MKKLLLLSCALLIMGGAEAAKKSKQKKQATKTLATKVEAKTLSRNSGMRLCDAPSPQPAWFLELPKGFRFPENFQPPASYRLVTTIDSAFNAFLNGIPYDKSLSKISLPVLINNTLECKEFNVSRTMTMDSALQAKYPELLSFKAFASDNSLNSARIDCDGINTRIMITYDSKVYYITSVVFNTITYYACYAKDDSNFIKQPFER